jgi:predicted dehydrogenase
VDVARRSIDLKAAASASAAPAVAFIGAGNYASQVLVPAFRDAGARLKVIASAGGVSGAHLARKSGFESTTTEIDAVLADPKIDAVVIATRHDSHARYVRAALAAGKHVFVEKPLALDRQQLAEIATAYRAPGASGRILTVGFNRRFAPHVQRMKALLDSVMEPKCFVVTVNAGAVPREHWTQDPRIGGGRIVGEACHFIDLLRYLAGQPITGVQSTQMGGGDSVAVHEDKMTFTLRFADGSFGSVHYLANGSRSFPKERIEALCAERVLQLDNFRRLTGWGWPGFRRMSLWRQDKGNAACARSFVEAVRQGGAEPIAFDELLEVTRVSFEVVEAAAA